MKRHLRKKLKFLNIFSLVPLFAALIFLILANNFVEAEKPLLIVSLILVLTSIIMLLVVISIYSFNFVKQRLDKRKINLEYLKYPVNEKPDYKAELLKVRTEFVADTDEEKNWFKGPFTKMKFKALYDFNVIKTGKIYYGCLVQANNLLFVRSIYYPFPGVILYSTDEYFESNPLNLIPIATALFADKQNNILKYESEFFSNVKLPDNLTNGKDIYMTTLMINAAHLPTNTLAGRIFPIIADPQNSTSAFVVNDKYWTKDLIANFIHNKFEK